MIDKCGSHKEIELGSFPPQLWVRRLGWVWDKTPVLLETGTLGPSLLRTQMLPAEKCTYPQSFTPGDQNYPDRQNFWGREEEHIERHLGKSSSFINSVCVCVCKHTSACVLSHVAILWTMVLQAPLFIGFPRQEYWSGLTFPSPGSLPSPGIEPASPAWQADSLLVGHLESPCVCSGLVKTAFSF